MRPSADGDEWNFDEQNLALHLARQICREAAEAASSSTADLCASRGNSRSVDAQSIRMTLSLAFLSPVLAEAAMEGRLPRGFSVKRLVDLPMLWSEQWRAIGLQEPAQVRAELG